jgi:hypothetical protein
VTEPSTETLASEIEAGLDLRSSFKDRRLAERDLTYHVRLVLDNDRGSYERRREIVREHLAARDACPFCGGLGVRDYSNRMCVERCEDCEGSGQIGRYPHQLGDRLRAWCEELAGLDINENDLLTLLAREVLSTAFAWVDWSELAATYIEEERAIAERC